MSSRLRGVDIPASRAGYSQEKKRGSSAACIHCLSRDSVGHVQRNGLKAVSSSFGKGSRTCSSKAELRVCLSASVMSAPYRAVSRSRNILFTTDGVREESCAAALA